MADVIFDMTKTESSVDWMTAGRLKKQAKIGVEGAQKAYDEIESAKMVSKKVTPIS